MKSLHHLLRRPIAFHPAFVDLTGSVKSALFLSQACYWTNVKNGGWFYKTRDDWTREVRLTRREQESARNSLLKLGLLEEKLIGCPAKLFYKINLEVLSRLLEKLPYEEETAQLDGAFDPNQLAENVPSSWYKTAQLKELETTTETTKTLSLQKTEATEFCLDPNPPENGKKKKPIDPRHRQFTELIVKAHKHFVKDKDGEPVAPLLGPASGNNLKKLLASYPKLDERRFRRWLTNYHESNNHNAYDSPAHYILKLPNYEGGPLNKFGRPDETC